MDDFKSGPKSFTITLDSSDPLIETQEHDTNFTAILGKPLEFTGEWEVALTQLIFKTEIQQIQPNYCTISIKDNYDKSIIKFEIDTTTDRLETLTDLINAFHNSLPNSVKYKVKMSQNGKKLSLSVDGKQVMFPKYLDKLFGFDGNIWLPIFEEKTTDALFKPNFTGHSEICHILCDIIVPQQYGCIEKLILQTFTIPQDSNQMYHLKIKNPTYIPLMRTYISFINIKIVDRNDEKLVLNDKRYPIILSLNFRQWKQ